MANLEIDRINRVDYSYPDLASVPVHRETHEITVRNCMSSSWTWEEKLTLKSTQRIESKAISVLTNIASRKIDLSLDSGTLSGLGVKVSAEVSHTTTVQATDSTTHSQDEEFTIEKPFKMEVPARTRRFIHYSDGRTQAQILADIQVILDGDVQENHVYTSRQMFAGWRAREGEVWGKNSNGVRGRLSKLMSDVSRTLTIQARIDVSGSDRSLNIELFEQNLDAIGYACDPQ